MIEWKHEKNVVDYRIAEEAMSKRVEDIISNRRTELIWFLEHNSVFTLGTSAKTNDFKHDVNIPIYQTKRGGQDRDRSPAHLFLFDKLEY